MKSDMMLDVVLNFPVEELLIVSPGAGAVTSTLFDFALLALPFAVTIFLFDVVTP